MIDKKKVRKAGRFQYESPDLFCLIYFVDSAITNYSSLITYNCLIIIIFCGL